MNRKIFYLVLCVLGFALPYSQFVPWVVEHGLDMRLFVQQLFANRIGGILRLGRPRVRGDTHRFYTRRGCAAQNGRAVASHRLGAGGGSFSRAPSISLSSRTRVGKTHFASGLAAVCQDLPAEGGASPATTRNLLGRNGACSGLCQRCELAIKKGAPSRQRPGEANPLKNLTSLFSAP
jgi:hypothetical protein